LDAWTEHHHHFLDRRISDLPASSPRHQKAQRTAMAVATLVKSIHENMLDTSPRLALATKEELWQEADSTATAHVRKRSTPASPEELRRCLRRYWLRQLRRRQRQAIAHLSAILGLVGAGKGQRPYACGIARDMHAESVARCLAWAAEHELVDANGAKLSLLDVIRKAPHRRFATLYSLALGIDQALKARGLVPVMYTLTLPPEYHPSPSRGMNRYNPKISPAMAVAELMRRFGIARRKMQRHGLHPVGYWVREPHMDGTPHLHALIYMRREDAERIDGFVQRQFPEPDSWDGAEKGRVASTRIFIDKAAKADGEGAEAPTYMMKYLVKTLGISGDDVLPLDAETDGNGHDQHGLADREGIAAWRAERDGKTFGLIGVQQGIRGQWSRLAGQAARERDGRGEGFVGNPHLMAIIEAMKERRWGDALCLMGALKGMGETPTTEFVKKPATSALGEIVEKIIGVRQVGAADEGLVSHDAWTVCPIVGEGGTDPSSYPREGDMVKKTQRDRAAANNPSRFSRDRRCISGVIPSVSVATPLKTSSPSNHLPSASGSSRATNRA
jgi:DNA-directed RNA polymerase specialized sigma24 family protein